MAVLPFLSLISRGAGRAPALRAFALMAAVGLAILTTTGASAQQVTPRPLAGDELPWDVSAVLGAVLLAMRSTGEVDTTPVTIARGAIDSVREPGFDYSGFRMDRVVISQYGAAPAGEGLVLAAALSFADPSGRRTAFSLSADYRAQDGRLLITRAGLLPLAPVNPAVRQFILPGELAAKMPQGGAVTFAALLDYVSRNALSEDSAQPPPDGARDYLVFAFFLDRLPPNAETGLLVAEKEEGVDGDAGQPLIIDDQGWRVVVQRVTFAANGGRPLYFKALYRTEGDVAKQSGARIVAQISSQLGPARPAGGTSQPPSRTRLSVPNLLDRN